MIEIAGVQPEAPQSAAPGMMDRPVQQIGAEALADELGHEAKVGEFDVRRRAAIQLAWILSSGLVVSVLLVTAWLALVAAVMVWLFEERLSWPLALVIGAGLNIAGAGALLWWMRSLVIEKPFTALLRQLKGENDAPRS